MSGSQGLKYLHQDIHPEGWGFLHQYIGQAHYFQWKNRRNSKYWHEAIKEYQEAYKTLKDFPEHHLDLLKDFIRAYFDIGEQEQSEELQSTWKFKESSTVIIAYILFVLLS